MLTEVARCLYDVLTLESFFKLSRSRKTATFSKISCERHSSTPNGPADNGKSIFGTGLGK